MQPELAALAGNCSYLITTNNSFGGNHADIAGAVMYSTNISSMQLACAAGPQDPRTDCPEWSDVGVPANTVGGAGIVGYGPGLAFPPAGIIFSGNSSVSKQISYISDGSSRLPLPAVNVLDQAGNVVKLQPMRANFSVTNVSALANGASLPQLPGQTEASSDANGDINIADLILIATPGTYHLLVALPDFPQVMLLVTSGSNLLTFDRSMEETSIMHSMLSRPPMLVLHLRQASIAISYHYIIILYHSYVRIHASAAGFPPQHHWSLSHMCHMCRWKQLFWKLLCSPAASGKCPPQMATNASCAPPAATPSIPATQIASPALRKPPALVAPRWFHSNSAGTLRQTVTTS